MTITIDLDEAEASLVYRVVKNRFGELRSEIRHTKDSVSKDYLKHKERLLRKVMRKFPEDLDTRAHMQGFGPHHSVSARFRHEAPSAETGIGPH